MRRDYKIENENKIRELIKWCNIFENLGLTRSEKKSKNNLSSSETLYSSGNLSFRVKRNSFLITASCLKSKKNLKKSDFVLVKGCKINRRKIVYAFGSKDPSSESILHYLIYKNRKDVNAIFHGHFPSKNDEKNLYKLLKNSKVGEKLNKIGISVAIAKKEKSGTLALAKRVLEVLNKNNFIVLKGHGFVSLGKDMKDGGNVARKIIEILKEKKV